MLTYSNLLVPPLLFFILGFVARAVKSDLELPSTFKKVLSVYLMIGIGLHGGLELKNAELGPAFKSVVTALGVGFLQPIVAYSILTSLGKLDRLNSAAIAAHYGSVSVGTFLTAIAFLEAHKISYETYPVIMLSLMESPAIFIGLLLAHRARQQSHTNEPVKFQVQLIKSCCTNAGIILLLGSLVIGYIALPESIKSLNQFYRGIFNGVLSLFLLGLGLEAATRLHEFKQVGVFLFAFGVLMPLFSGLVGALIGHYALGFSQGGALLVAVLVASASYIAVPPAVKLAIPEANPSFYLTLSMGITFPFNVLFGIPLYAKFLEKIMG